MAGTASVRGPKAARVCVACGTRGASPSLWAGVRRTKGGGPWPGCGSRDGAGVLGYTALPRRCARVGQGHAVVGVWDAATAHPPRTAPAPAATPAKTRWLGGLRVKELATRGVQEVRKDDCLGWAVQLAYYLLFAVFPFFSLFDRPAGFSAHSQPAGGMSGVRVIFPD